MCLSDTEKGFQTQKRLNNPSLIGAPKCRDGTGMKIVQLRNVRRKFKNSLETEVPGRNFRHESG